jgi:hypothetical protein
VRRRLPLLFALLACGSPPQPTSSNQPPAIVDVQPESPLAIGNGPTCALTFRASFEDPDLNDLLTARFYVDDEAQNASPVQELDVAPSGSLRRSVGASLQQAVGSATSPLHPSGKHRVELLVSDGLLEGRSPLPRSRLSDGTQIPTYAVTYAWEITVEQGRACP